MVAYRRARSKQSFLCLLCESVPVTMGNGGAETRKSTAHHKHCGGSLDGLPIVVP